MSNIAFNRVYRFIDENYPEDMWFTDDDEIMLEQKGNNSNYDVFIKVKKRMLSIVIPMPGLFPEDRFSDFAKAICFANCRLEIGRFDMVRECGIFEFNASTIFGGRLDDTVIDRLVRTSLATADRFYPAFYGIIFEDADPEAAIDFVDSEQICH